MLQPLLKSFNTTVFINFAKKSDSDESESDFFTAL